MIYILLSYLFSPLIYLLVALKKKKAIKRILVIQTAKIGDLICSTPVFREIKIKYPESHLTAIIDPINKELLENNPHVNEILTIKTTDCRGVAGKLRLSGRIRKGRYDIAICLNPNVPYAMALFWGLVPLRLSVMPDFCGLTFKLASVFSTNLEKHIRGNLVITTYMRMLKAIGIESENISGDIYQSKDVEIKVKMLLGIITHPLIGIAVSSGNKMKELGTEKIAELSDKLIHDMDCHIVLIGSGQDIGSAENICSNVKRKEKIINTAGMFSLGELPALIKRLSLFIGVDSGITYMADALSVPLINIAGPSDIQDQRPRGKRAIILQKEFECVPCSHAFKSPYKCRLNTRKCITSVSIDEICYAANKIIYGK